MKPVLFNNLSGELTSNEFILQIVGYNKLSLERNYSFAQTEQEFATSVFLYQTCSVYICSVLLGVCFFATHCLLETRLVFLESTLIYNK